MKLTLSITDPFQRFFVGTMPGGSRPKDDVATVEAEGDATMIAGYLRAMADSIDPPKPESVDSWPSHDR